MVNPLSGHTTGQTASSESLKDGAGLTSTSLTNLYEGLHGNGIVRLDDRAYGDTNRQNTGTNTAGHVTVSGSGSVTVYGGYAVLGGILYSFANGPNSSKTYTAGDTTWHLGSLPSVPASNSDVIVTVYVVADNNTGVANVKHHFGTPVVTSTGTPLTSTTFLSQPQGSGAGVKNEEATVLAVLRYTMTGGAANVTASLNTPTVSDKRCLLSNSPMYLTPLTSGATGSYASGDSIDHANRSLDTMNGVVGGSQSGAFNASPLGAIWQSHSPDGHAVLYYSARRDQGGSPARNTWRLAPNEVKTITTSSNQTATFDGPNIWVITTTGNITLTPTNTFPHSHTIRVYHPSGSHTLHFDPSGLNYDVAAGKSVTFGYDGSAWSVIGLSGAGVGTVTSIATTAPITGGTITTTGTIGISAATTSAAGSMSAADKTKLDGIEANADVTDATNVDAAGAIMNSDVATKGQIIVGDGSGDPTILSVGTNGHVLTADSTQASGVKWAAVSGGGGDEIVDADGDTKIQVEESADEDIIRFDVAGTEEMQISASGIVINEGGNDRDFRIEGDSEANLFFTDAGNDRVGIGNNSPTNALHVKSTETTGDAAYGLRVQTAEWNVGITRYGGIHINNDNTSPMDGADWDSDRWQISERDGNQFDIAHGTPTNTNVGASDTLLRILSSGKVGINLGSTDPSVELDVSGSGKFSSGLEIDGALDHDGSTLGFFGIGPASKTAVAALGPQTVTASGSAAELTSTQNAINALQAKLDALISSLSGLGLV